MLEVSAANFVRLGAYPLALNPSFVAVRSVEVFPCAGPRRLQRRALDYNHVMLRPRRTKCAATTAYIRAIITEGNSGRLLAWRTVRD